jgi:NADH dehydrogenase
VIVGGGFAGVNTARYLQRGLPAGWEVVLFSQENHLIFTPLLGDVVGSAINPLHVVWPIRRMLRHVSCRAAAVTGIDLQSRLVHYKTATGRPAQQRYEHLVLACGSVVNLDIIPGMAAHGWPLKTTGDALALRNHVIGLLEKAEVETDPALKQRLLSVVVIGAGFSGVEVCGEIADLLLSSCWFYGRVRPADIRVYLLEARERILPELPESLAAFAQRKMTRRGISIRLGAAAQAVTERGVKLKGGEEIEAGTVVCTIGTMANPLLTAVGLPLIRNRLKTAPDMRVEGQAHVWSLGDCAAVPNAYDQQLSPPTAQFAQRQARQLAANLRRAVQGEPTRPFSYKPQGMLASIGNHRAVGLIFGVKCSGLLTWMLWRGIYLSKMPTLARKLQILFDWTWQLLFPRDIVQLSMGQTERFGRAHFETGQFVFHRGDVGDKFYVVECGRAGVYLDEAAPPVAILGPGQHFGEAALLRKAPRSASIRAEEPLDVLMMGQGPFSHLVGNLEVLRTALERSVQGQRSSQQFLEAARDWPRLSTGRVHEVMSRPPATLPVGLSLAEALRRSRDEGKGGYPVVDDQGRLLGICTRSDFYRAFQQLKPPQTALAEIMHRPVLTVREGDALAAALLTFLREPVKRLVVVADDDPARPVGMLTPFDILQVVADGWPAAGAFVPVGTPARAL